MTLRSRGAIRPSCAACVALEIRGGRREGRVQAAPMARQQIEKLAADTTGSADIRPSLRSGFNGVLRALPGNRAFLLPSPARSSHADLTPASGCQNHTTSPSARAPFVRTKNRARRLASIAARLTSGDDWPKRPSSTRRDGGTRSYFYEKRKRNFPRSACRGCQALIGLTNFRFSRVHCRRANTLRSTAAPARRANQSCRCHCVGVIARGLGPEAIQTVAAEIVWIASALCASQ